VAKGALDPERLADALRRQSARLQAAGQSPPLADGAPEPAEPAEDDVGLTATLIWLVLRGHDVDAVDPSARRLAVRAAAVLLARKAPGRSVEVRVPPDTAIQCVPGPRHTRGTPPAVVETDSVTFLRLAGGESDWATEVAAGRVRRSGQRADLSPWLPVVPISSA
jgi:hypothetical protein